MFSTSIEELNTLIMNANSFAIITHARPDADAISSALAMFWYLTDNSKNPANIDVIIPKYNADFDFIPGIEHIKKEPSKQHYDIVIVVDCSDEQRIERSDILQASKHTLCLDHHEAPNINVTFGIINPQEPSCSCLIYKLLSCNNQNFLNCVAIGLISDTCNFTLNTNDSTLKLKDELSKSVNFESLGHNLENTNSRTLELAQLAIKRGLFKISGSHKIYCSYLLQSDLLEIEQNCGLNHKAIINEINKIIDYTTLNLIIENNQNQLKGSLRTSSDVDLNAICTKLVEQRKIVKGGGHSYSAGYTINIKTDIFECISQAFEMISTAVFDS